MSGAASVFAKSIESARLSVFAFFSSRFGFLTDNTHALLQDLVEFLHVRIKFF